MLKEKILLAAVDIALKRGLPCVTRSEVARIATVARGTIHYHYGSMGGLLNAVIERAIKDENLRIIADAILRRHSLVAKIPGELRKRALKSVSEM